MISSDHPLVLKRQFILEQIASDMRLYVNEKILADPDSVARQTFWLAELDTIEEQWEAGAYPSLPAQVPSPQRQGLLLSGQEDRTYAG